MKEGYIRVTDALYFISGLSQIDPEIRKNAANRGKIIHEFCDALIKGIEISHMNNPYPGYIDSFRKWMKGLIFVNNPGRLYCDEYGITGEFDAIYMNDSGLVLVDFKTPVSESKTWRLQLSAYAYLAKKFGLNIQRIEVVKLNKDGKPPKVYVYEEDFGTYLQCLDIYKKFFIKSTKENELDYL